MEHLVNCLHPLRVYNKHLDEYVWTRCGKCEACKRAKASRWIFRLEQERMRSPYTFFVTLTYDESHLPRLYGSYDSDDDWKCVSIHDNKRGVSIPFDELIFSSEADKSFFQHRMSLGGIPYASVKDIQKYHKRLSKYIHDNITQEYSSFRYWVVSEFGSSTLRPHFHGIYFVSEQRVANLFEEAICKSWQNGIIDCQPVSGSASSYVAQYLNEFFDLPSFYSHSKLRPFFVCSKQPPIGIGMYDQREFREIFEEIQTTSCVQSYATDTSLSNVPLLKVVENRLFPKCQAFSRISHSLRIALFGLAERKWNFRMNYSVFWYEKIDHEFDLFIDNIRHYLTDGFGLRYKCELYDYLLKVSHGFNDRGINCLRRLFYLSKRILKVCKLWKVSLEYYVRKIEDYWNKKEMQCLSMFYEFQQNLNDPEQLVHCYPEFALQNEKIILPLSECEDYKLFKSDSEFAITKNTKSHFKNMYFDSLKDRNNSLFNVLLTYYYAKKCNEVIETFGIDESERFRHVSPAPDGC